MKRLATTFAGLLLAGILIAQNAAPPGLPEATTPLADTDQVVVYQGGPARQVDVSDLRGAASGGTCVEDADADTKVCVEESADEDIARVTSAGDKVAEMKHTSAAGGTVSFFGDADSTTPLKLETYAARNGDAALQTGDYYFHWTMFGDTGAGDAGMGLFTGYLMDATGGSQDTRIAIQGLTAGATSTPLLLGYGAVWNADASTGGRAYCIGDPAGASVICLSYDSSADRLYHDKDGDGTKDAGEEYIDATASSVNSFETINVSSGTDPVADSSTDTLNLTAGTGITITGDSSTDTITIAATGGGGGGGGALPSIDNAPSSAPDWSCEFDSTICSGSFYGTAGTSTPVSGSISNIDSVSGDPLYSYSHVPGKVCFQSDESTTQEIGVQWSHTPATDETILVKLSGQNRAISNDPEGTLAVRLTNSGDSNEVVYAAAYKTATVILPRLVIQNNGSTSTSDGQGLNEANFAAMNYYLVLWKDENVYWAGFTTAHDGVLSPLGSLTKTGVTSFDTLSIFMYTANETPSAIYCIDYIRQWDSLKFDGLVNE